MAVERRSTEQRRVEIADAALRLIASRGIAELSTRLVAEAVGLSTGALFRHFGSLDDILCAVADRVLERLQGTYPPADLPPVERVARLVDARTAAVGEHPGILRLVLSEQFALALPRRAADRLQEAVASTRAFLIQALREGQERGEIREDVAAEALAAIVMGTMQMVAFETVRGVAGAEARARVRDGLMRLLTAPRRGGGSR